MVATPLKFKRLIKGFIMSRVESPTEIEAQIINKRIRVTEYLLAACEQNRAFMGFEDVRGALLVDGDGQSVCNAAITPDSLVVNIKRLTNPTALSEVLSTAKRLATNGDPTKHPVEVADIKKLIEKRRAEQKNTPENKIRTIDQMITTLKSGQSVRGN